MVKYFYYYCAIGAGSFFGGASRYFFESHFNQNFGSDLPFGTLAVNILGSFIIGLTMALFLKYTQLSSAIKTFITTGFCGGFTTLSSFSYESMQMFQNHHYLIAVMYIIVTALLGLSATKFGILLILRGDMNHYYTKNEL